MGPRGRLWYAPEGADLAKLKGWLPEKTPEAAPAMSPQVEFALAF
jgi:hypothetical protein